MKFSKLYADDLIYQSKAQIDCKDGCYLWVIAKPLPSHYILDRLEEIWDVMTGCVGCRCWSVGRD